VSSGTVLYLIYFPLLVILAVIFAGWKGLLLALLVLPAGYLVLYYQEIFRERMHTLMFQIKSITNKNLVTDLSSKRKEIMDILDHI
jgi:predicted ABC-type exoprotein transport system permease subunit